MRLATPDFGEVIARRIAAQEFCWFPGLAKALVGDFWANARFFDPAAYSTAGWLGVVPTRPVLPVPGHTRMVLEALPASLAERFDAPALGDVANDTACAIARALARLVPGGAVDAVTRLVRSVHCIAARGPGYDCSHSEPTIPFSILVSVPAGERHAELRLAESLLHEAMHLQLTLIEQIVPIVGSEADVAFSPWQQCERPVQGLLHGLYVFTAIAQWLTTLACAPNLPDEDRLYVDRRWTEICEEVAAIATLPSSSALTPFGRMLAAWLLDDSAVPCRLASRGGLRLEDNRAWLRAQRGGRRRRR